MIRNQKLENSGSDFFMISITYRYRHERPYINIVRKSLLKIIFRSMLI